MAVQNRTTLESLLLAREIEEFLYAEADLLTSGASSSGSTS